MRVSGGHVKLNLSSSRLRAQALREAELGTRQRVLSKVTSQSQILIQLESLILAQNERWRQA